MGGGDGSFDTAGKTARVLLKHMGAETVFPLVCSHNTDNVPAVYDERAAADILKLAEFFNE